MSAVTNFLGQVFGSPYGLKSPAHASRLYIDDYYRLTPKIGFMYYVIFKINNNGNRIIQNFVNANGREIGMLVKAADLPKFKMQTETLNQYNRKTIVQSRIDYQPISFTFHDDHNNTSVSLWEAYYRYYFADSKEDTKLDSKPSKYGDNKYSANNSIIEAFNYGLNNGQKAAFFDSIEIYQLARQQFTAYSIVNPIISDWSHDQVDQTQSKLLENKMTVAYEAVQYATGQVKKDSPAGFASIHYDTRPSPLTVNGNNTLFGQNGIFDSAADILGGIGQTSPLGLFATVQKGVALTKNLKNVTKSSIKAEGYSLLTGALDKIGRPQNSRVAYKLGVSSNDASTPAGLGSQGIKTFLGANGSIDKLTAAVGATLLGKNSGVAKIASKGKTALGAGLGLPGALPTDQAALEKLKEDQDAEIARVTAELRASEAKEAEYNARLEAANEAGDEALRQEIYAQMEADNYTKPSDLENYLAVLQANENDIDKAIQDALDQQDEEATSNEQESSEYDAVDETASNDFDFPDTEQTNNEDIDQYVSNQESDDLNNTEWGDT